MTTASQSVADAALAGYGNFGFPAPPADRPWIYTNFVQSLDGIVSLLGKHASGGEIAQSRADRWLMDLLRAHADGLLMGMNTLREEQRNRGPESRGIVFQVVDPEPAAAAREARQRPPAKHLRHPCRRSRSVAVESLRRRRWWTLHCDFARRGGTARTRQRPIRMSQSLPPGPGETIDLVEALSQTAEATRNRASAVRRRAHAYTATWREPIWWTKNSSPSLPSRLVRLFRRSRSASRAK